MYRYCLRYKVTALPIQQFANPYKYYIFIRYVDYTVLLYKHSMKIPSAANESKGTRNNYELKVRSHESDRHIAVLVLAYVLIVSYLICTHFITSGHNDKASNNYT